MSARLALADGTVMSGLGFGAPRDAVGELVFNTAMSGYEEVVTDPSYRGQLVVMTAPQMGNIGWNDEDLEASGVLAQRCAGGLVVRELCAAPSNWRSQRSLDQAMRGADVPGIAGVDTRALTRILRQHGALAAALTQDPIPSDAELVARARRWGSMEGRDLVQEVTCDAISAFTEQPPRMPGEQPPSTALGGGRHVVLYDYGAKRSIARQLCAVGLQVTVVPARTPAAEVRSLRPHGVMLSNGPGDPAALPYAVEAVRDLIDGGLPLFGICLGHQILALALGARTYKLKFGHHGINHPVLDRSNNQVEITSQNHGFAVDLASLAGRGDVECTHLHLSDNTVEGLRMTDRPVFSVQYHPEAAPGPHDAHHLFRRFARLIAEAA